MYTDPISDMLTRIRNAGAARHATVTLPASRIKYEIARVLSEAGFVGEVSRSEGKGAGLMTIGLKYHKGKHVLTGIQRESRPGQRKYVSSDKIPQVLGGYGATVVTTSRGVMTGKEAAKQGLGGELICSVW